MEKLHIAIDGPAGAGKSTIARMLAKNLCIDYLDTGAMYRALTYHILKENIDLKDDHRIIHEAKAVIIDFFDNSIYLNAVNVDKEIRSSKVNHFVSAISKIPQVREIMVDKQRKMAEEKSVIMDGRDIGTVVLPNANFKFYLDASIEIRARRRYEQIGDRKELALEDLKEEIMARDEMDQKRKVSPLAQAEDAFYIDTSDLSIQEVINEMTKIVNGKK